MYNAQRVHISPCVANNGQLQISPIFVLCTFHAPVLPFSVIFELKYSHSTLCPSTGCVHFSWEGVAAMISPRKIYGHRRKRQTAGGRSNFVEKFKLSECFDFFFFFGCLGNIILLCLRHCDKKIFLQPTLGYANVISTSNQFSRNSVCICYTYSKV